MSKSMRPWALRIVIIGLLAVHAPIVLPSEAYAGSCNSQMAWDTSTWESKVQCLRTVSGADFREQKSRLPEWCSWREAAPEEVVKFGPKGGFGSDGKLLILGCGADPRETGRDAGQGGSAFADMAFVENEQPPDPAVLAQEAYTKLAIPAPKIGISPDQDQLYVQMPTWLWVDNPGELASTVAAGGVSVTATASLTSTTWTLGEPARNPSFTGFEPGPAVTETCEGAGTPPPADVDWKAEPPCGHTFRWRSLPERTSGSGKWPITATTTWTVAWQSNTGQSGSGTLSASSQDAVAVGEYRILLVAGR